MKVINLDQGSADWLKWREGGLGASDCPIILHESKFKTAFQLWLEKTGRVPKPAPTIATQHGVVSEETARKQLARELNMPELAPLSVMDDEAEYLRASYDGYDLDSGTICEIKCPLTITDHRQAKEGEIPFYYRLQMYQQMHIARTDKMIYYSWWKGEGVQIPVTLDEVFWYGTALAHIQEFWHWVQTDQWPMPNGETVYATDKELIQAAGDWLQANKMRERADYCGRIAEAVFKRAAGEARNLIAGGVQCQTQVWRPRYMVSIDCENPEIQAAVAKACSPLLEREGIRGVREVTWHPRLVQRFTEVPE